MRRHRAVMVLAGAAAVWCTAPLAVTAGPAAGGGARGGARGPAVGGPGSGTLNAGGFALVNSVSCASAGNCAAGGQYSGRKNGPVRFQGFVVSERNGSWGKAIEVPGSGTLNKGGSAELLSVSCGSAGTCAAGGDYTDRSEH